MPSSSKNPQINRRNKTATPKTKKKNQNDFNLEVPQGE